MIDDPWAAERRTTALASIENWYPVTPSDSADLPTRPRMVTVAVGGVVRMVGADGTAADFTFMDGQDRAASPVRILATGTTATGIVAGY